MAPPEETQLAAEKPARKSLPAVPIRVGERWLAPWRDDAFRRRTWNTITVTAICAIYAGILGYFLYRDAHQPVEIAKNEEIPVELVPPPPPPPPPPKAPQPPPPPQAKEIEKPASSAPRAPSEEKIETDKLDETTSAPKAETPPQDGEKAPPPQPPAAPTEASEHDDKQADTKQDVLKKDAEALDKAAPTPPKKPEKIAKAPPRAKPRRDQTALQKLAGKSDTLDYKLARPTKKAPITGGNEDNRYLSNVFAKIMAQYRGVDLGPDADDTTCTVAFEVADDGTILAMQIAKSSGDEELDEAAIAAVSHASPLPPLPPGAPHGLIARIGPKGPTMRMGRSDRE